MSKVALSLAVLATLSAGALAQTTYPVPFNVVSKKVTVNTPSPYIAPRYLYETAYDLDLLPDDLVTWFNTSFSPYWSMGTDFNSIPEFMASQLYVPTAAPSGVYIDTQPITGTGAVRWVFKAPWKLPIAASSMGYAYNDQGSNYWVVVVKKDSGGNYSLVPGFGGGSTPSYYGTGAYDAAHNNIQTVSGMHGVKIIDFYQSQDITTSVTITNDYYIMLCNYSYTPGSPYIGITVRDAVAVSTYMGSIPMPYPPPQPVGPASRSR